MKKMYEAKQAYVKKLNAQNAQVESLSQEQHLLIRQIAHFRHQFHCNMDSLFNAEVKFGGIDCTVGDSTLDFDFPNQINAELKKANLPPVKWDFTDTSDIPNNYYQEYMRDDDGLHDYLTDCFGISPAYIDGLTWDDDKVQEYAYDYYFNQAHEQYSKLHANLENWLGEIDRLHGTQYQPTGFARYHNS